METRERILDTARRQFNEFGIKTVTVRQIAAEMQISHGNLCYHFPSTTDIIRALYEELVGTFSNAIAAIPLHPNRISFIRQTSKAVAEKMYDYRFFFIDFVPIIRNDEWIRKHYRRLMEERKAQFAFIYTLLRSEDLIHGERFPGHYARLAELQFLSGDFWLSRAVIKGIKGKEKQIDFFLEMQFAPVIGCLTEKGLKLFLEAERS